MINNTVGADLFDLNPDAIARYNIYKDYKYETPEGFLSGLYDVIRYTKTPEGEQLYGQPRRE